MDPTAVTNELGFDAKASRLRAFVLAAADDWTDEGGLVYNGAVVCPRVRHPFTRRNLA
jgi:hypothetical protein